MLPAIVAVRAARTLNGRPHIMKYIPWRVRRRRVLAATIAIQAVVVGVGALVLERRFFTW
jgi:hypothetical protein